MIECVTQSAEGTRKLGERLGSRLRRGDVLLISGDLGAGKTTLVQGIATGMGIEDPVTSPTFTLIHEYGPPANRLVHIDPYRLESENDILGTGFEEYLRGDSVLAVEWSERLGALTPQHRLDIRIVREKGDSRRIYLQAFGRRYDELIFQVAPW